MEDLSIGSVVMWGAIGLAPGVFGVLALTSRSARILTTARWVLGIITVLGVVWMALLPMAIGFGGGLHGWRDWTWVSALVLYFIVWPPTALVLSGKGNPFRRRDWTCASCGWANETWRDTCAGCGAWPS